MSDETTGAGRNIVAITADDLQDERGRAVREEYAIAEEDMEVIIRLGEHEAERLDLADLYHRRLAEQARVPVERRRNVLVVDDDETIRSLISRLLARRGLAPDTAVNGEHALEKLRMGDYAVVLLDLMMPRVDGFEVLKRMRAERMFLPVIVISAVGEKRAPDLDPFLVTAIIRKPFNIDVVADIAAELVTAYAPRPTEDERVE
ncbi:MAG TPA: response regulator [Thermoanaerobaculia bacterium]|nr:response regulator [Thermoanaerobaculia bacterium]